MQEMRLQQQEKRLRMGLPKKKKAKLSQGCCDLQPHFPCCPAPLTRQQAPTWQWVCHPPLLHQEQQDQLSCCHNSRLQVSSEDLPHGTRWVFSSQAPVVSDLHSRKHRHREPGLDSQVRNVPPKKGREQRGSSFF